MDPNGKLQLIVVLNSKSFHLDSCSVIGHSWSLLTANLCSRWRQTSPDRCLLFKTKWFFYGSMPKLPLHVLIVEDTFKNCISTSGFYFCFGVSILLPRWSLKYRFIFLHLIICVQVWRSTVLTASISSRRYPGETWHNLSVIFYPRDSSPGRRGLDKHPYQMSEPPQLCWP